MGIGIFGILNISKEALFTQQAGISVTANNLANVNTEGYSRQTPVIETVDSQRIGGIIYGRGSTLQTISKSYDRFLNNNVMLEKNFLGMWETQEDYLTRVETIFNESTGLGLNESLNKFWNAWSDLADHPEGISERVILQQQGESISAQIINMVNQLESIRTDANQQIGSTVLRINQLSGEIAQLNEQILSTETQNANANDLTDQRSLKTEELRSLIDASVIVDNDNQVTILTSFGHALVSENISWELSYSADSEYDNFYAVIHKDGELTADITEDINGGSLKGLIDVRDIFIPKYLDDMDMLAATLVAEVNRIHYSGYGLDGTTGNYFFNPNTLLSEISDKNRGGASIYDLEVTDTALFKPSDYDITFLSGAPLATKYEMYDTRNEAFVFKIDATNSTIVFNDSAGGAGSDSVASLAHGSYTGEELAAEMATQFEAESATSQRYSVQYRQSDRSFTITNLGAESLAVNWGDNNSTAAEVLGFNGTSNIAANESDSSSTKAGTYIYSDYYFEIQTGVNDSISFADGAPGTAVMNKGLYTGEELAAEIESRLEGASDISHGVGNGSDYTVAYNAVDRTFSIAYTQDPVTAPGALFQLYWSTSNAASTIGFNPVNTGWQAEGFSDISDIQTGEYRYHERSFNIDGTNNQFVFQDGGVGDGTAGPVGSTYVTAVIPEGKYTGSELAQHIERQMETAAGSSRQDYIVTYDVQQGNFTIINRSTNDDLDLIWSHADTTAALTLGYMALDQTVTGGSSATSTGTVGSFTGYKEIAVYGITAKITDDTGPPEVGDVFSVSGVQDASTYIAMDAVTASDPEKIAAAQRTIDIDGSNNTVLFDDAPTLVSGTYYKTGQPNGSVVIPSGRYTPEELAAEIEKQLEQNGSPGRSYAVRYDGNQEKFVIASNPSNPAPVYLLWEHEQTTAEFSLGFSEKVFTITQGVDDTMAFDEGGATLQVTVPPRDYTGEELAAELEDQLNATGTQNYGVQYDTATRGFTFTNNGTADMSLHWTAASSQQTALNLGFIWSNGNSTLSANGGTATSDYSTGAVFPGSGNEITSDFTTGAAVVGDNRNSLELADLKDMTVIQKDTLTINTFYNIVESVVGTDVQETNNAVTRQNFILEQLEQRRQSVSGVSIDEEMVNLMKYQQAYSVSAKLIGVLDEMLDALINL